MTQNRAAVLVPGARGGQFAVWMRFAAVATQQRGARQHPIEWQPPDSLFSQPDTVMGWVREHVEPVLEDVDPAASTLIVGKSLGSNAAVIAAERGLPAIWLTPLLGGGDSERFRADSARVVEALRVATEPFLLIGGTADWAWDGDLARQLTPHVCEIERADHGFCRPGEPLAASAEVLARMGTAIEEFLDTVVWPG